MDQYKEAFIEEARELLVELESTLLELEQTPDDKELVGRVFRAMHTIKGSGAMFGFNDVATFTHEIETVYDLVRDGTVPITKELIDLTLLARDQITRMVEGSSINELEMNTIVQSFLDMIPKADAASQVVTEGSPASDDKTFASEPKSVPYRIRFRPNKEIFANGTNPNLLLDELRELGEYSVTAHTQDVPHLNDLEPESCYLYWDVILSTDCGINSIEDVFIFVADECELNIDAIDDQCILDRDIDCKKLGEILLERGDVSIENLEEILKSQKRVGELLVEKKGLSQATLVAALAEQQQVKQIKKDHQEKVAASSVRVPADKLDTLVDLVGELVTVQARLSQDPASLGESEIVSISEELEHLTAELRDNTMGIRMLPIGSTFARFKRLVRDLSKELGKEIELKTEGGETELDKTIIEKLNDPLVHLIRNSIDHGIEQPDERAAAGKPSSGTILLTAAHKGADVFISIHDDGKGLDPEAIRAKAIERGLVAQDAELSEDEIFSQVFAAGFSTAEKVTDVSGRGVGMDVVKRSIESLRGAIEMSSRKGEGSTVSLKLPLTLAIIDGLMVRIGDGDYVFPLSSVEECVELTREEADRAKKRKMMDLRGTMTSYLSLREMFDINGERPPFEKIVIAESNGRRVGFGVDLIIGQHQTMLKTLGEYYKDVEGVSGATIKGDGSVALMLDVNMLVRSAGEASHYESTK